MLHRRFILSLFVILLVTAVVHAREDAEDEPFGRMSEKSLDRFLALANAHRVDIYAELEKAYQGDERALSKVMGLSVHFDKLDKVARVYGNLLFASFINLVEDRGEEFFVRALTPHSEEVQQRVRDFVYYAVVRVPHRHRDEVEKEVRDQFRSMFPADYVFGRGNALFR